MVCLYAAAVVKQKISSDTDLATSETAVGPVGAFLTTLGLTYFYRGLGFQPYDRDPRDRYYRNRYYDSDSSSSDEETPQQLHDRLWN